MSSRQVWRSVSTPSASAAAMEVCARVAGMSRSKGSGNHWHVPADVWQRIESLLHEHGQRLPESALGGVPDTDLPHDRFYILVPPTPGDIQWRTLKCGNTFAVLDRFGDIPTGTAGGIFYQDCRHLSEMRLLLGNHRPLLLKSTIRDDNLVLAVDLSNPDWWQENRVRVRRNSLHLSRSVFLEEGVCFQRFRLQSYELHDLQLHWSLELNADFADIFEVRGVERESRGEVHPPVVHDGCCLIWKYDGLDGVRRFTLVFTDPPPQSVDREGFLTFSATLRPQEAKEWLVVVVCGHTQRGAHVSVPSGCPDCAEALRKLTSSARAAREQAAHIYTSNELFNDWLNRSWADLRLLVTETEHGPYPYAGIPWFSTVFGRDGIITALESLWIDPSIARGVLQYLAQNQATEFDPTCDAEPGKILHEVRLSEMARTGEVPFRRYYGSIDSTPLFLVLAYEYAWTTGDLEFIRSIWPNLLAAMNWMEQFGDRDGDGFLEYQRRTTQGLRNQGWKDSEDAVFHADGTLAEGPIALCEVQAYAYGAWQGMARLAQELGDGELAEKCKQRAANLRNKFEERFWDQELRTYVIALDGRKRPCRVRASNAGHCLLTGIASEERGRALAEELLSPRFFSGWGIRTLASGEARYNPMSYHNGSIWPHDNALIALGLARYGHRVAAGRLLEALFEASLYFELRRMPELFCGFDRVPGEAPTLYPVACSPQAWAAASGFLTLRACLGLRPRGIRKQLRISRPYLPPFVPEVRVTNLPVGKGRASILFRRHGDDVTVRIEQRAGDFEVVVIK